MSPERAVRRASGAGWAVGCLSIVAGLGCVLLVGAPVTASASESLFARLCAAFAVAALVASSASAVTERSLQRIAVLMAAVAATSILPVVVGWQTGPEALRAVAVLGAPFIVPLLLDLAYVAVASVQPARPYRVVTPTAYALTAVCTITIVVTRDPFLEAVCPADCTLRILAVAPDAGVAAVAHIVWGFACSAMAVAAIAVTVAGSIAAGGARRRAVTIGTPASAALVVCAASVFATTDPAMRPASTLLSATLLILAAGVGWTAWLPRQRRAAVRSLATRFDAAPAPGVLRDDLARRLGDGRLELAYRLPGSDRLVDRLGRDTTIGVDPGRTTVALERGEELVAVVDVDSRLMDRDDLLGAIGAAARVAIDNERFAVALRAQYEDLTASRRRTVERADQTRRAIERDLHDGAQAELVGLLYELARLRAAATREGDSLAADRFALDGERVSQAATRLRDLSHGVYPAVLDGSGLEAALWSLTDMSAVPVTIDVRTDGSRWASAERVSYLLVAEAAQSAATEGSPGLAVLAQHHDDAWRIEVRGVRARPSLRMEDRVGAIEGALSWDDDGWRAVLPCAS